MSKYKTKAALERARQNIEKSIENAELNKKHHLFSRRITLARAGLAHYAKRQFVDAVKSFHIYIKVLEDLKGVQEGGLLPHLFDREKDLPELLLLSGVYWDLVKIYDRGASPDSQVKFDHYMQKYILFSKDMPFSIVCTETIRKYVSNEKPLHKEQFKHAYRAMGGTACFVATALLEEIAPGTWEGLHRLRDEYLLKTVGGRALVRIYYAVGPSLAWAVQKCPLAVRSGVARMLDQVAAHF